MLSRIPPIRTGEMAIAFAEAGMTLPPWRHHRSMLSKWLPSRARTLRVVPPADRSPSKAAGRDDATAQPVHRRQSPVRPRTPPGGQGGTGPPAKRVHAPKQPSPAMKQPLPAAQQQASHTAVSAPPAKPAAASKVGNNLCRASLLSKEIQDLRSPPVQPPAKADLYASAAEASLRANSGSAWSGASSDGGSTHGASAACPRIRTVKMRGGSSAGGSSGGRMPTSLVLPPVSAVA